jgi:S-formylglutathione hydrolase FrmB
MNCSCRIRLFALLTWVLLTLGLFPTVHAQGPAAIHVRLAASITDKSVDGRVLVFVTENQQKHPMHGPSWFGPEPFAAIDVKQLRPDGIVTLDDQADCFPKPISQWPAKQYRIQAVLDRDFYYQEPAAGPGNFFSEVVSWSPDSQPQVELTLDKVVPEIVYQDSERVKIIQRPSQLLSKHHDREVIDRIAVILPPSYESQPQRHYPVYYEITGFGGNLRGIAGRNPGQRSRSPEQVEFIHVMLTGECKWGHHVYANSATNGPRGDALVQEMIPYVESKFRAIADSRARFVGGHSSGGWSSLWLQINYPDIFGGVFSTSPDPVDFRNFQGIDLYANPPQNAYVDLEGNRRPLARRGQQVILRYDDFCRMDQVLGRGGQMRSFDAVFSPLDASGSPQRCWDATTGQVVPAVAEVWKKYDMRLILKENWQNLRPRLAGKIHIAMGDLDTFYLEGATRLLAQELKELGSDAKIDFIPEASHNLPSSVMQKMRSNMSELFLKHYSADGIAK